MRWAVYLAVAGCSFDLPAAAVGDGRGADGTPANDSNGTADSPLPPGPPVIDTTQTATGGNVSTLSWTHSASGANRLVVVGISWGLSSASIASLTYGQMPMTQIGTRTNTTKDINMALWMLVAPPTGAQTIRVAFSGQVGDNAIGGSVSFTNVNQTTPTGTFSSSVGGGPGISVTASSGPDELVIDTVAADSNPSGMTLGSGQTQLWKLGPGRWGLASVEPGAASVTMSWTETGSSDDWAQGAVSIKGG